MFILELVKKERKCNIKGKRRTWLSIVSCFCVFKNEKKNCLNQEITRPRSPRMSYKEKELKNISFFKTCSECTIGKWTGKFEKKNFSWKTLLNGDFENKVLKINFCKWLLLKKTWSLFVYPFSICYYGTNWIMCNWQIFLIFISFISI